MMKQVILALLILSSSLAIAEERTFTITIPEAQLNYIGKLLGKQPIEDALATLQAIQAQVTAQIARERDAERERIKSELSKEDKP